MPVKSWADMLEVFEGRIPHCYADGGGNVTAGIGHLLQTPEDAATLFADPTARNEWETVRGMHPSLPMSEYAAATRLRLTDSQIYAIRDQDVARFTADLAYKHPETKKFPPTVLGAFLDIFYNTGKVFPRMLAAATEQSWGVCARESHRIESPDAAGNPVPGGIQHSRNVWTRDSILSETPV